MSFTTWLGLIVGAAIIPLVLSIICLAIGRPKTFGKAMAVVAVVVVLTQLLMIKGGGSLDSIEIAAAALTFLLAMGIYYLARRLLIAIVKHDPSSAKSDETAK